jgi:hypothetical protein
VLYDPHFSGSGFITTHSIPGSLSEIGGGVTEPMSGDGGHRHGGASPVSFPEPSTRRPSHPRSLSATRSAPILMPALNTTALTKLDELESDLMADSLTPGRSVLTVEDRNLATATGRRCRRPRSGGVGPRGTGHVAVYRALYCSLRGRALVAVPETEGCWPWSAVAPRLVPCNHF